MDLHEIETGFFSCRGCGWTGRGSEADSELFEECIDFTCPACGCPLAVAAIPMADGNERDDDEPGDDECLDRGRATEGGSLTDHGVALPPRLRAFVDEQVWNTALVEFAGGARVETRELDENISVDLDADGHLLSLTVEHAQRSAGMEEFSYERLPARVGS